METMVTYKVTANRTDLLPKIPSTIGVMIRIQYPPGTLLGKKKTIHVRKSLRITTDIFRIKMRFRP